MCTFVLRVHTLKASFIFVTRYILKKDKMMFSMRGALDKANATWFYLLHSGFKNLSYSLGIYWDTDWKMLLNMLLIILNVIKISLLSIVLRCPALSFVVLRCSSLSSVVLCYLPLFSIILRLDPSILRRCCNDILRCWH